LRREIDHGSREAGIGRFESYSNTGGSGKIGSASGVVGEDRAEGAGRVDGGGRVDGSRVEGGGRVDAAAAEGTAEVAPDEVSSF
jgi:hypothetical protein